MTETASVTTGSASKDEQKKKQRTLEDLRVEFADIMEKSPIAPEDALSACLAWLCTPRGGNNFYGRILNSCNRKFSPGLGTMAVSLTRRGRYTFLCDPQFLISIPEPMRMMVLVHEAAHLVYSHLERMIGLRHLAVDDNQFHFLMPVYNIAADMAVNDTAVRPLLADPKIQGQRFYDYFVWPEQRNYPQGKSFEEYLVLLLQDLQKENWNAKPRPKIQVFVQKSEEESEGGAGGGSGGGGTESGDTRIVVVGGSGDPSDDQSEDSEGQGQDQITNRKTESPAEGDYPDWFKGMVDSTVPNVEWFEVFNDATQGEMERAMEQANKSAKGIVRKAVEATEKNRGTVPGSLQKVIDALLAEHTVPWEQVLRMQMKSSISRKMGDSMVLPAMHLISLDWCEPYPGIQPEMTFNIMAFFDTSGSMSDSDFLACCSELAGLVKTEDGVNVRLVMFDAGLQHEEDVTSDDQDFMSCRAKARHGYGGTSFTEPVKYLSDDNSDDLWVANATRVSQRMRPVDLGIIFTDGYAPMPDFQPQIPLIWCLTKGGKEDPAMTSVVWMDQ